MTTTTTPQALDDFGKLVERVRKTVEGYADGRTPFPHCLFVLEKLDDASAALLAEVRSHREREATGGWVRCEEHLPTENTPVWFVAHEEPSIVHKGQMGADDFVNTSRHCWRKCEVAWWSPLRVEQAPPPPAPKGEPHE